MKKKPQQCQRQGKSNTNIKSFLNNLKENDLHFEDSQITQCVFLGVLRLKPVPSVFSSNNVVSSVVVGNKNKRFKNNNNNKEINKNVSGKKLINKVISGRIGKKNPDRIKASVKKLHTKKPVIKLKFNMNRNKKDSSSKDSHESVRILPDSLTKITSESVFTNKTITLNPIEPTFNPVQNLFDKLKQQLDDNYSRPAGTEVSKERLFSTEIDVETQKFSKKQKKSIKKNKSERLTMPILPSSSSFSDNNYCLSNTKSSDGNECDDCEVLLNTGPMPSFVLESDCKKANNDIILIPDDHCNTSSPIRELIVVDDVKSTRTSPRLNKIDQKNKDSTFSDSIINLEEEDSNEKHKNSQSFSKETSEKPRRRRTLMPTTMPSIFFNTPRLLRSELGQKKDVKASSSRSSNSKLQKIDIKPEKFPIKQKKEKSDSKPKSVAENFIYEVVKSIENSSESVTRAQDDILVIDSSPPKVEPLIIKLKKSTEQSTQVTDQNGKDRSQKLSVNKVTKNLFFPRLLRSDINNPKESRLDFIKKPETVLGNDTKTSSLSNMQRNEKDSVKSAKDIVEKLTNVPLNETLLENQKNISPLTLKGLKTKTNLEKKTVEVTASTYSKKMEKSPLALRRTLRSDISHEQNNSMIINIDDCQEVNETETIIKIIDNFKSDVSRETNSNETATGDIGSFRNSKTDSSDIIVIDQIDNNDDKSKKKVSKIRTSTADNQVQRQLRSEITQKKAPDPDIKNIDESDLEKSKKNFLEEKKADDTEIVDPTEDKCKKNTFKTRNATFEPVTIKQLRSESPQKNISGSDIIDVDEVTKTSKAKNVAIVQPMSRQPISESSQKKSNEFDMINIGETGEKSKDILEKMKLNFSEQSVPKRSRSESPQKKNIEVVSVGRFFSSSETILQETTKYASERRQLRSEFQKTTELETNPTEMKSKNIQKESITQENNDSTDNTHVENTTNRETNQTMNTNDEAIKIKTPLNKVSPNCDSSEIITDSGKKIITEKKNTSKYLEHAKTRTLRSNVAQSDLLGAEQTDNDQVDVVQEPSKKEPLENKEIIEENIASQKELVEPDNKNEPGNKKIITGEVTHKNVDATKIIKKDKGKVKRTIKDTEKVVKKSIKKLDEQTEIGTVTNLNIAEVSQDLHKNKSVANTNTSKSIKIHAEENNPKKNKNIIQKAKHVFSKNRLLKTKTNAPKKVTNKLHRLKTRQKRTDRTSDTIPVKLKTIKNKEKLKMKKKMQNKPADSNQVDSIGNFSKINEKTEIILETVQICDDLEKKSVNPGESGVSKAKNFKNKTEFFQKQTEVNLSNSNKIDVNQTEKISNSTSRTSALVTSAQKVEVTDNNNSNILTETTDNSTNIIKKRGRKRKEAKKELKSIKKIRKTKVAPLETDSQKNVGDVDVINVTKISLHKFDLCHKKTADVEIIRQADNLIIHNKRSVSKSDVINTKKLTGDENNDNAIVDGVKLNKNEQASVIKGNMKTTEIPTNIKKGNRGRKNKKMKIHPTKTLDNNNVKILLEKDDKKEIIDAKFTENIHVKIQNEKMENANKDSSAEVVVEKRKRGRPKKTNLPALKVFKEAVDKSSKKNVLIKLSTKVKKRLTLRKNQKKLDLIAVVSQKKVKKQTNISPKLLRSSTHPLVVKEEKINNTASPVVEKVVALIHSEPKPKHGEDGEQKSEVNVRPTGNIKPRKLRSQNFNDIDTIDVVQEKKTATKNEKTKRNKRSTKKNGVSHKSKVITKKKNINVAGKLKNTSKAKSKKEQQTDKKITAKLKLSKLSKKSQQKVLEQVKSKLKSSKIAVALKRPFKSNKKPKQKKLLNWQNNEIIERIIEEIKNTIFKQENKSNVKVAPPINKKRKARGKLAAKKPSTKQKTAINKAGKKASIKNKRKAFLDAKKKVIKSKEALKRKLRGAMITDSNNESNCSDSKENDPPPRLSTDSNLKKDAAKDQLKIEELPLEENTTITKADPNAPTNKHNTVVIVNDVDLPAHANIVDKPLRRKCSQSSVKIKKKSYRSSVLSKHLSQQNATEDVVPKKNDITVFDFEESEPEVAPLRQKMANKTNTNDPTIVETDDILRNDEEIVPVKQSLFQSASPTEPRGAAHSSKLDEQYKPLEKDTSEAQRMRSEKVFLEKLQEQKSASVQHKRVDKEIPGTSRSAGYSKRHEQYSANNNPSASMVKHKIKVLQQKRLYSEILVYSDDEDEEEESFSKKTARVEKSIPVVKVNKPTDADTSPDKTELPCQELTSKRRKLLVPYLDEDGKPRKLWSVIDSPPRPVTPPRPVVFKRHLTPPRQIERQSASDDIFKPSTSTDKFSETGTSIDKKSPMKQPTIIEMFSKVWMKKEHPMKIMPEESGGDEVFDKRFSSSVTLQAPSSRCEDEDSDTESRVEWIPEEYAEYKFKYSANKMMQYKPIFKCKICMIVMPSYYKLLKHRKEHERKDKPYHCGQCGTDFANVEDFSAHLRIHKGKHPYMCPKCDLGFWTKSAYEAHIPVHILKKTKQPVKKFRCDVCAKEFSKLCDVERHTRVHTGEKPCICNICNKRFQQAHNLSKHLLTHLHIKPFHCEICNKQFGRNDVLRRHLLTHSVDKPVKCSVCHRGFIRHSQLLQHMRRKHPDQPFDDLTDLNEDDRDGEDQVYVTDYDDQPSGSSSKNREMMKTEL